MPADQTREKTNELTPDEARAVIKAIEEAEQEEADEQQRRQDQRS